MSLLGTTPYIANDVFVAPSSTVVGSVFLVDRSSCWYNAVIKGDCNTVRVGLCTAVMDRAVLNTVPTLTTGFPSVLNIGNWSVIGPNSVVTSSTIGDYVSIGEGCTVGEGSIIEDGVVLEPGTVVPPGSMLKSDSKWGGNPAVLKGEGDWREGNKSDAEQIALIAEDHVEEFLPFGNAYQHLEETTEEMSVERQK